MRITMIGGTRAGYLSSVSAQTWLYLDPFRGSIVRKEVSLTRINRWFYHGLHSLDFPFLYYRCPLWDAVVISTEPRWISPECDDVAGATALPGS